MEFQNLKIRNFNITQKLQSYYIHGVKHLHARSYSYTIKYINYYYPKSIQIINHIHGDS